jgi:inner membrane protein
MLDWIASLGGWAWILLGLLLIGVEVLAPAMFMIWLGLAALITGAVVGLTGISWQPATLIFATLAIVSVLAGRYMTRQRKDEPDNAEFLNAGTRALIGKSFTLDRALTGGIGQLKVGDSVWRITGPDAESGDEIRVTGIDGTTLKVEKL